MDGLEVCRRLRAGSSYIPILILTARSSDTDRVLGLEIGGDDYLTKPFNIRELVARIRAILRRRDALASQMRDMTAGLIYVGALRIDTSARRVRVEGKPVELTAREFDLLVHFAQNPGRVFTRAQLLDLVWGQTYSGYEHTVNTHINRLRAKIEADAAHPRYILTSWGVGYQFTDEHQTCDGF
jgi:DNA-binding response OmpR family regulator